jgi:hypothetical protein
MHFRCRRGLAGCSSCRRRTGQLNGMYWELPSIEANWFDNKGQAETMKTMH